MTGPRSFAAKCAGIMHGQEPEALTEAEVQDGWGELVNIVGGNLTALVPPISCPSFACLGQRVRLTVLQPRP